MDHQQLLKRFRHAMLGIYDAAFELDPPYTRLPWKKLY